MKDEKTEEQSASEDQNADNLPGFFHQALEASYGAGDVQRIIAGLNSERATTLRVNALKSDANTVSSALTEANLSYSHPAWYPNAFVLDERGHATLEALRSLPLYDEGGIYLQSLSSMVPPLALDPKPGEDVIDMCAAPGGKTTQMAALGGKGCHITACEMHAPRAEKLAYNLEKQGATTVNVMRVDARRLDSFFSFDKVLLDAPCSGSGTINMRDPKLGKRFNEGLFKKVQKQQAALFSKALEIVKPGGCVVYSTCSVLKDENEQQVERALKKARRQGVYKIAPIALEGMAEFPILPSAIDGALTVCPTGEYEGFFICKIKREA